VTEANEVYWSGEQNSATYVITADLPQGSLPLQVFLPIALGGISPSESLLESHLEGSFIDKGQGGDSGTATGFLVIDDLVVGLGYMTPKEPSWITRRWEVRSAD
jgi:hypothetical protein